MTSKDAGRPADTSLREKGQDACEGVLMLRLDGSRSIGSSAIIYNSPSARKLSSKRVKVKDTYISSLISDLRSSLEQLGSPCTSTCTCTASPRELEEWAIFIHECTSKESRGYHNIHRAFEISSGAGPIQLIAAFFRDTVNCLVDQGLSKKQRHLLEGVVNDKFVLSTSLQVNGHPHLPLTAAIFGVTPGQDLSDGTGLDAFLSAVIVTHFLKDALTPAQLAQVVACLEATIPFRGPESTEALYNRLSRANQVFSLGFSQEELTRSIQRAADLANRSHGNFSAKDATFFLDHTWSLLPEHNAALRESYLYTVHDFQVAVKAMYDFLMNLDPSRIFTSFRGVPNKAEMRDFVQSATLNLNLGRTYVRSELLSVSIVAAFAMLTGGDTPMSFFMGDLPSRNHSADRLADHFPTTISAERSPNCNLQVYNILKSGRHCETSFDTRNSPLAAFLYAQLGDVGMEEILQKCMFPMTDKTVARNLLSSLPQKALELIGRDIASIAVSRAERIGTILQELASE
jgi:hypothetical protein